MTAPAALDGWIEALLAALARHRSGPGAYARLRPAGGAASAPDPYGCADAANTLYTVGRLPRDPAERAASVERLRAFQAPDTGLFEDPSHHPLHTTAHCLAALELFDAGPRHALASLAPLEAPGALEAFLESLAWRDDPWLASHRGAGAFAARVLAGEATAAWQARYFAWLAAECDPRTGLWRRGCVERPYRWGENRFPHLAGSFHYLFNLEWARRPHPHPAALLDTCLELLASNEYPLCVAAGFAEIDWVYCTTRSHAQSGARGAEVRRALEAFAERHAAFLLGLDLEREDARDLHRLFGSLCALAELQRVLPGRLPTARPLRLVLDRRPFL